MNNGSCVQVNKNVLVKVPLHIISMIRLVLNEVRVLLVLLIVR